MVAAIVPTMTGHRAADPSSDQDTGGHARGGPEHGDALRLGQESKAEPRRQEIDDADRDSEPDRASPPRQVDAGGQLVLNLCA